MNQSQNKRKIVKLCVVAVMAVLVMAASRLQIKVPALLGVNRFHLGNTVCAMSGILLGPWWGGLAAGLGSALFDIVMDPTFITDAPITFVTKGLYGVVSGLVFFKVFRRRSNYVTEVVATLCGAVTYIVLYLAKKFFLDALLLAGMDTAGAWLVVIEKIPSSLFNAIVAVIFAPILSVAVSKALKRAHLGHLIA